MKLEEIKRNFWNPQTRKCLGRTWDSWAKIVAFYIALYTCLAAIWSLYFFIFHLTISDKYPKWQLDESIIGSNPGLGIRPRNPRNVESALISFNTDDSVDLKYWLDDINKFIESQEWTNKKDPGQPCESELNSSCPFDNRNIPVQCTKAANYSFSSGRPCILIKLNRIYNWRPKAYASKPEGYPEGLAFIPNNIHITCGGQHGADKEHIGPIEYFPNSIETKYYPYLNQPDYQSPYMMVHFTQPKLNTLIYIECKIWAENVQIDRAEKKGMISFELFVESLNHEKTTN